ncbi:MAG: phosphotyrosine protein phosphatase [Cyanobacteria bacterium P01_G01_bin.38]
MNVLFICSRNQWRSPTAAAVWRKIPGLTVRSAGTSPRARKTVTSEDIRWADVIFVMETQHKQRLQAEFRQLMTHKRLEVMDIPDEYRYMDPELVDIFEAAAEIFLSE